MAPARPQALRFTPAELKNTALKFGLDPKFRYIVFNNYLHSLKVMASKTDFYKRQQSLFNYAREYRTKEEINIIHTGKTKQNNHDRNIYDVDVDLRGRTSVEECFIIAAMKNVLSYIGFDSFWLHLFNIYDKNSLIMLRPGFSTSLKGQIKKYVAVPYKADNKKVIFID